MRTLPGGIGSGGPGLPTTGPHVFVAPVGAASSVDVTGGEGHHLAAVLRIREGEPVSLADDTGWVYQAVARGVGRDVVALEVTDRFEVPADEPRVCVVQALGKGRKVEEVVQRLTEVGVDRLRPVVTARTVKQVEGAKADRVAERWRAVALAAAQQSRRARLLQIDPVAAWPVAGAVGAVLYEGGGVPLSEAVEEVLDEAEITLAIGPEGGFELREVEASGLTPATLGQTILRTETAGVVAASVVLHRLGRLG
ncbi:16S rRNA (uracil(1498)-N(3))-methyltransferase [Euzebya sp.]|uniref:RsmE family RNA methyltransferase n=1 Tax=Euzebya sp. TaxID=1971409 RepID=UPI003514C309